MTHDVDHLISAALDGELAPAERDALRDALRADASAIAHYVELATAHALLGWEHATRHTVTGEAGPGYRAAIRVMRRFLPAMAAAVVVAACGLALFNAAAPGVPADDPRPRVAPVASVLDVAGGSLLIDDKLAAPGSDYVGSRVQLDGGEADLLLPRQVRLHLHGSSDVTIDGTMSATFGRGAVTFDCPPEAVGYAVRLAPGVRVVDLGTRFRVSGEAGRYAVRVESGSVRIDVDAGAERSSTTLAEGGGVFVDTSGGRVVVSPAEPIAVVNGSFESPRLMASPGSAPNRPGVEGWTVSGAAPMYVGTFANHTRWKPLSNADGEQMIWINTTEGTGVHQTLAARYEAGYAYKLTVALASRQDTPGHGDNALAIQLYAGGDPHRVVAQRVVRIRELRDDHLNDFTLTTPPIADDASLAGEAIGIRIVSTKNVAMGDWTVDHVRLLQWRGAQDVTAPVVSTDSR